MRTVHDPFEGRDVQISDKLTDRLRGKYASDPHLAGPQHSDERGSGGADRAERSDVLPPFEGQRAASRPAPHITGARIVARFMCSAE